MFASKSVAITKVGIPPARNPQRNISNYQITRISIDTYNHRLKSEEAKEQTDKDYYSIYNDLVVIIYLLN